MAPMDLSPGYKLLAGIILGFITGFILVKSDLAWRKSVLDFLTLKDGRIIKTILLFLGGGTVLFFLFRNINLVAVHVRPGFFWASLAGGIIAGVGLVFCALSPVTSIAAFASGRLYAFWTILGMVLALPAVRMVSDFLSRSVYSWGDELLKPPQPIHFFSADNPALFIAAITVFMIFLVQFTIGDNAE